MKKIISFVLAAAMSLSTLPVLADWNNDEDIMSLLSELNIMVGDDDGNLRLDDNVSVSYTHLTLPTICSV